MPTNSNIERSLGIVVGKLEGIEKRLERQDKSRDVLHQRLDQLVIRTTSLESDMLTVKNRTDDFQTVSENVKTMTAKAQGAGTLGHWAIKISVALVGFAGWIVGIYTYLTGRPPP